MQSLSSHAWTGSTVVIGGDAGIKYQAMDVQMAADLLQAEPAQSVRNGSTSIQSFEDVRRAIKVAATPPCGPVYLCLPEDILDAEITEKIIPAHIPSLETCPGSLIWTQGSLQFSQHRTPLFYYMVCLDRC